MNKKGLLVIVSGPSGAGKGTVVSKLIENKKYSLSTSVTTREPRANELEGVHYFFRTTKQFQEMIKNNMLLEYAKFCDNYYGTPLFYVEQQLKKGKHVILEIEVQGALQVKKKFNDAVLIFLTPKTIFELKKRLLGRATENEEKINLRMKKAKEEIKLINMYDYIVINDIVEEAVQNIDNIIKAEQMSAKRHLDLIDLFLEKGV